MSTGRVAVIGGGIGGLTAARALRDAGLEVSLVEAGDRVGGVLRSVAVDGYLHEHGATGSLGNAPVGLASLAGELGVELEEASAAARKRWVWIDGALRKIPGGPRDALTTEMLSWRGRLHVLGEPLRRGRPELDESIAAYARRRLGPEIARSFVAPFVVGVFAGDAERLSVRAAFPKLWALEERGGLVRGMVRMMRDTRASRRSSRLQAPVGGMARLVDALAADLGPIVRTGVRVERVDRVARADRPGGGLVLRGADDRPVDAAVLAVPAYTCAELVEGLAPELARELRAVEYAPVAIAYLGYRKEDVPHPLDGFGFLVADGERLPILGCVFESVLWTGRAPVGHVLMRCMIGGVRDPHAVELGDNELIDRARAALADALGVREPPRHVEVVRHPRAIAQYNVGHAQRVERADALAEREGLVLGGSGFHGVAVNACIADAARVVQRVRARVAAVAAVALTVALTVATAACGSDVRRPAGPAGRDGGDAAPVAETDSPRSPATPGGGVGGLELHVVWPTPDAALLRSPGINACGAERAPALPVAPEGAIADRNARQRMVSVEGAVVTVSGTAADAPGAAELVLRACRWQPRVAVVAPGGSLAIASRDERRHEVRAAYAGGDELAHAGLPVIGARAELTVGEPGVVRVTSAADPADAAWAVVAGERAAVTGEDGRARFRDLPAGEHVVRVWYPPLAEGGDPIVAELRVTVEGGAVATERVALSR